MLDCLTTDSVQLLLNVPDSSLTCVVLSPPPLLFHKQVLDRLTKESVQLLNVLDSSLTHLSEVTAPIHSRATALTAAQHNIAGTKEAVDKLLEHLDTSRRVRIVYRVQGWLVCAVV